MAMQPKSHPMAPEQVPLETAVISKHGHVHTISLCFRNPFFDVPLGIRMEDRLDGILRWPGNERRAGSAGPAGRLGLDVSVGSSGDK